MASLRQLLSQLDPDQLRALDNPQMLTPANREAITRPRTVAPPAVASIRDMMARQAQQPIQQSNVDVSQNPLPTRQLQPEMNPLPTRPFSIGGENVAGAESPFGSGEPFASERPRRTQMRDYIADDSQYLRDLEQQPRNWKDKTVDAIRGLNQHFNPGSGQGAPTKRERDIARAQGTLSRDIAVDKARTASELGSLVPVQLDDGSVVMAPRRGAGKLASDQQRIGQMDTATNARIDGLKSLDKRRRVQSAIQIYNSGGANNPATLAALSKALELPADLQAKFNAGEVVPQVDANGGVQLINKRDGSVVDTGVTSYETTKEGGRNTRRDKNAADAMERTKVIAASGAAKLGDIPSLEKNVAKLNTYADDAEAEADELDLKNTAEDSKAATDLRKDATKFRLAAVEAAEVIAKAKGAQAGSTPSGATKGRLSRATFVKNNPKATAGKSPQEIDEMIKGGGYAPIP